MRFGLAVCEKWRIVYSHDVEPDIMYVRIFNKQSTLHTWMAQNEDKTIHRMTIQYIYPI